MVFWGATGGRGSLSSFEKLPVLGENLRAKRSDVAYLSDIFGKFNDVNLELQGDALNFIKTKSAAKGFMAKLDLMKERIRRREFSLFPNLASTESSDENLLVYIEHLTALKEDFSVILEDILSMGIPVWIVNPYADLSLEQEDLQEELLDLATNEELKAIFTGGYQKLWLIVRDEVRNRYPASWNISKKLLVAFPSSYLVERAFSAVSNLITTKRNRLDIVARGDLRLNFRKIDPYIKGILEKHQVQPSH